MSAALDRCEPDFARSDVVPTRVSSILADSQVTDFIGLSGLKGAFSA